MAEIHEPDTFESETSNDDNEDGDYEPPAGLLEETTYEVPTTRQSQRKRPRQSLSNVSADLGLLQRDGQPRLPTPELESTFVPSHVGPRSTGDVFCFLKNHTCHCDNPTLSKVEKGATCTVLKLFPITYIPELDSLFCRDDNRLLIPKDYPSHLFESHGLQIKALGLGKKEIQNLATHLLTSFSLIDDREQLLQQLPRLLAKPLPTSRAPLEGVRHAVALRYPCPEQDCSHWAAVSHGKTVSLQHDLNKHTKKAHSKPINQYDNRPDPKEPQWTYRVSVSQRLHHVFKLPDNYSIQVEEEVVHSASHDNLSPNEESPLIQVDPVALHGRKWEVRLGWKAYREQLQAEGFSVEFLTSLLRPVARQPRKQARRKRSSPSRYLEERLAELKPLLCDYLMDASTFAHSTHPLIRNLIIPR
jgi:hypothetical protein